MTMMGVPINKRQQIRNERTLQDLINNIAGNDRCADCSTGNPGWASWSLGIFLCVRCAAIHRKLGVHISKVKSLSMDAWTTEQVEKMKRIGNVSSNHMYNPRNIRPNIPVDIDEVDGVLERFIRQKYDSKTLSNEDRRESQPASRHATGSTASSEEYISAQLPPKPPKRFNFSLRSSSSVFPLRRTELSPPLSPDLNGFTSTRKFSSPRRPNKPSKILGADIGGSRHDNYELKLIALREMGFPDDRRNLSILKGQGGNVDGAAATLLRLGESHSRPSSGRSSPAPATPPKDDFINDTAVKGLNPFDRLDVNEKALPPPPTFESTEKLDPESASSSTYNPFLQPLAQPRLNQQFLGLSILQPSQLFPHGTGGHSGSDQHFATNPFISAQTPPLTLPPSAPQSSQVMFDQAGLVTQAFHQPQPSALEVVGSGNPFLNSSPCSQYTSKNPFCGVQLHQAQQPQAQVPQSNQYTTGLGPATAVSHSNPFWANSQQTQDLCSMVPVVESPRQFSCTNPFPIQAHAQSVCSQPITKIDKASILALYDKPMTCAPAQGSYEHPQSATTQPLEATKRNNTMPGFTNTTASAQDNHPLPLHTADGICPPQQQTVSDPKKSGARGGFSSAFTHISHDSVDFTGMLSGRHSPDAFSGLSARLAR